VKSVSSEHSRAARVWNALSLTLFFLFLEQLKTCRSIFWLGVDREDGWGLALGAGFYFLILFMVGAVVARMLSRVPGLGKHASGLGAGCAALGLWAFLSFFREHAPTRDDALVCAFLLGHTVLLVIGPWALKQRASALAGVAGTAYVAGALAAPALRYYSLFQIAIPSVVTWAPLAVCCGVGVAGLAARLLLKKYRVLRPVLSVVSIVLLPVVVYVSTHPPARSDRSQPNLVFIIADTLRYDAILDGETQPHLAALREEGVDFSRAYALAPWTMPSVSALFSSAYPPSLSPGAGMPQWRDELWQYKVAGGENPLPRQLGERGYVLGALGANALLWGMPGLTNDFDAYGRSHPVMLVRPTWLGQMPFLDAAVEALSPAFLSPSPALRPNNCTDALRFYTRAFLRRYRDRPFFLYLHHIDPHAPGDPPPRYHNEESYPNPPWPFFYPYDGGERWNIPRLGADFAVPEAEQPYVRYLYDGEVRAVDDALGALRQELARGGLGEHTYICFTSDHGEELWEHGKWGHGQSMYEELVHVPWIMSGPGIVPRRVDVPVSALDALPTMSDLVGGERQASWRGRSLAPFLRGETDEVPQGPIFMQGSNDKAFPNPWQAVIHEDYKLIRHVGGGGEELYELTADPKEKHSLVDVEPERAQAMGRLLDEWFTSFESTLDATVGDDVEAQERRQELENMGYLSGDEE
jgi:arylsulfatase A-like enzyme